jgi:hypothetical protein
MNLSKVITNKFISILAFIFVAVEAIPQIWENPDFLFVLNIIFWLIGAIFVWFQKDWAARLLAFLASIAFIGDIVFEIPKFKSNVNSFSADYPGFESFVPYAIFLSMLLESIFLFCFIYYGFTNLKPKIKGPQTT